MSGVRLEAEGPLAILTLDRPPLNLFDEALIRDLRAAVDRVAAEPPRGLLVRARARGGWPRDRRWRTPPPRRSSARRSRSGRGRPTSGCPSSPEACSPQTTSSGPSGRSWSEDRGTRRTRATDRLARHSGGSRRHDARMRAHRNRLRALAAGGAAALIVALAASAVAATPSRPVKVKDPRGDVRAGGLDLTRVQLGRSSGGS